MDISSVPRSKLHMRERNVCDMLEIHSSLLSCVREREMKQVEKEYLELSSVLLSSLDRCCCWR